MASGLFVLYNIIDININVLNEFKSNVFRVNLFIDL